MVTSRVYSICLSRHSTPSAVALAGEQLFREQADAVDVEQRAVGIEQTGLGFFHPD